MTETNLIFLNKVSINFTELHKLHKLADNLLDNIIEIYDLSLFDANKLKLIANLKLDKRQLFGQDFIHFKWFYDETPNSITKAELTTINFCNNLDKIIYGKGMKEICMPKVVAFSIIECIHLHYDSCDVIFHCKNTLNNDKDTDIYIKKN